MNSMEVDHPMKDWVESYKKKYGHTPVVNPERGEDGMLVGVDMAKGPDVTSILVGGALEGGLNATADEENTAKVVNWGMYEYDDVFRPGVHPVHQPSHYMIYPGMESKDIIKKVLTEEEYMGWLKGNLLKYRLRAGNKENAMQDIEKAEQFKSWIEDLT